jgi:hypothetical protein
MEVKIMDNEIYTFALKNTLNEIQNICPDIKSTFIFNEDGEIIAGSDDTPEKSIVRVVDSFDSIMEKVDAIGGIEGMILESSKGRLSISRMNDLYLVTVTSKNADKNYVNTVTRVLVPTVLKLLERINPTSFKHNLPKVEIEPEIPAVKAVEKPVEKRIEEPETREPVLPEPTVTQFIVENIGGLLVPADTVRIDNETLSHWQELYGDKKIEEVEVETFGGQVARCKVKPIKDSKHEGKGLIQVPEKIQNTLEIRKGELVRVKPVIE